MNYVWMHVLVSVHVYFHMQVCCVTANGVCMQLYYFAIFDYTVRVHVCVTACAHVPVCKI